MSNVKKGDVGTLISLNVGTDITGATSTSIEILKPSGATQSWAAVLGVDNKSLEHVAVSGDLDEAGDYIAQGKLTIGTGTWRGDAVVLKVLDIFK